MNEWKEGTHVTKEDNLGQFEDRHRLPSLLENSTVSSVTSDCRK